MYAAIVLMPLQYMVKPVFNNRQLQKHSHAGAFDHAGPDSQRVLERAAQLHPDYVLRRVAAEVHGGQQSLNLDRVVQELAGDDHCREQINRILKCGMRKGPSSSPAVG